MTVISLFLLLVVLPAAIGYCLYLEYAGGQDLAGGNRLENPMQRFLQSAFRPGDCLIYRKAKASPRPGPRARNVHAAENGDDYYYEVDKFWAVSDVLEDGRLVALTRTGKQIYLTPEDERLRKAGLLDRVRYRHRFPAV